MVGDLMTMTNNYFEKFYIHGNISITDGKLELPSNFVVGQYVRIIGSLLNDGVYKIQEKSGDTTTLSLLLEDEEFSGYVVGLAVPKAFVALSERVDKWAQKYEARRGLISESSLGGYYSWSASAKDVSEAFSSEIGRWSKLNSGRTMEWLKWAVCLGRN